MPSRSTKTANATYTVTTGSAVPSGVTGNEEAVNFSIATTGGAYAELLIFHPCETAPFVVFELDPTRHRTGTTWHCQVTGLPNRFDYGYRFSKDGPLVVDPYCHHLADSRTWCDTSDIAYIAGTATAKEYRCRSAFVLEAPFDWEEVPRPNHAIEDLIIYEMHVRGFTQSPTSGVDAPGTFLGLIERIPYLVDLGVNAVQLLPVYSFNELEYRVANPDTGKPLCQYWGYSPTHFFAPMGRYAVGSCADAPAREFRTLVRELHRAGIEVILDVVYNHSGEKKDTASPSLRATAEKAYFIQDFAGNDTNYSGCGNTLSCNHPMTQRLILNSLRYWVSEMGVDGFRFDLASALTRDPTGAPLAHAPVLEAITADPVLASTKLIAEAWDAAGLYQVGHFFGSSPRWYEWNGKFRDDVRRFVKGTPDSVGGLATRLCGSADMYGERGSPGHSINYVTAHDGFSLTDLVSYNHKHNMGNGEHNHDGCNHNDSWDCGTEGPTTDEEILALRSRQRRNFAMTLLLAHGVPMIRMGDEYGHTQNGNNNAWCQDGPITWFDWDCAKDNAFFRFVKELIALRKRHPTLRRRTFLTDNDISWHDKQPHQPDWAAHSKIVAYCLHGEGCVSDLYIAFNAHDHPVTVTLPFDSDRERWCWRVDTSQEAPHDITDEGICRPLLTADLELQPYSSVLLERAGDSE